MAAPVVITPMRDPKSGRFDAQRMADFLGVRPAEIARYLGVHRSTVLRHPTGPKIQAKAAELEFLFAELWRLLGSAESARAWLKTPSPFFQGKTALELIEENQGEIVRAVIEDLKEGIPL